MRNDGSAIVDPVLKFTQQKKLLASYQPFPCENHAQAPFAVSCCSSLFTFACCLSQRVDFFGLAIASPTVLHSVILDTMIYSGAKW